LHKKHTLLNLICDDDPQNVERLVRLRQRHLDDGLPSIVLISQGKSGSVTVGGIFNSGFDLPSFAYGFCNLKVLDSWATDYARGGSCHVTHLQPDRRQVRNFRDAGIRKLIVHVRDPRQTLVSLVHHLKLYPEQLLTMRQAAKGEGDARIGELALRILPYYAHSIQWIRKWTELESEIEILFSTFEHMVSDWDGFVDRYLDFYGADTRHFSKTNASARHDGVDYHFRKGKTDEWREVFTKDEADYLSSLLSPKLKERFGWVD
jgi:hypothetical protein